jgi:hypothetical protein
MTIVCLLVRFHKSEKFRCQMRLFSCSSHDANQINRRGSITCDVSSCRSSRPNSSGNWFGVYCQGRLLCQYSRVALPYELSGNAYDGAITCAGEQLSPDRNGSGQRDFLVNVPVLKKRIRVFGYRFLYKEYILRF